jgi:hypothetical protein
LKDLGLRGLHGRDKFIPEKYLRASIKDRVELLQGLIDSDGHIGRDQYRVDFTTTSYRLVEGIEDLVGSLGGSTTTVLDETRGTYTVRVKRLPQEIVPCKLSRKRERYNPNERSGSYRHMIDVCFVGRKEVQCISVDNDQHLYITDDYILTHNTAAINWKRWETFKTALYRGLVHAPHDTQSAQWAALELKYLQVVNTGQIPRVDKQSVGEVQTKDVADAISTVVETLIGDLMSSVNRQQMMQQPVRVGAEGGYQMFLQDGQHPLGKITLNTMHNHELAQLARQKRGGSRARQAPVRSWGARPRSRRLS